MKRSHGLLEVRPRFWVLKEVVRRELIILLCWLGCRGYCALLLFENEGRVGIVGCHIGGVDRDRKFAFVHPVKKLGEQGEHDIC